MAVKGKLAHYIDLADVRDSHKVVLDIRPTREEYTELALRCGILEVKDLDAHITLTQGAKPDLFRIEGELHASVVQACGVSFTPVAEKIHESFDEILTTDPKALDAPEETDENPNQPVELIENDHVDLGDIIAQWLAVSLNPYPRSDTPEFAHIEQKENESGEKTHTPFSVLEKLKK
jgi:uncharacterized metal-binding protein YceD (DUF177 family)